MSTRQKIALANVLAMQPWKSMSYVAVLALIFSGVTAPIGKAIMPQQRVAPFELRLAICQMAPNLSMASRVSIGSH